MIRRKFLKIIGLGVAAASVSTYGLASSTMQEAAVGIIMNELSFLKIDKKDVELFVDDFLRTLAKNGDLAKIGDLYTKIQFRTLYLLKISAKQSDMVEHLLSSFLWSTDFFRNRMDESQPVKYLGLYNAYNYPCGNPFSSYQYPS